MMGQIFSEIAKDLRGRMDMRGVSLGVTFKSGEEDVRLWNMPTNMKDDMFVIPKVDVNFEKRIVTIAHDDMKNLSRSQVAGMFAFGCSHMKCYDMGIVGDVDEVVSKVYSEYAGREKPEPYIRSAISRRFQSSAAGRMTIESGLSKELFTYIAGTIGRSVDNLESYISENTVRLKQTPLAPKFHNMVEFCLSPEFYSTGRVDEGKSIDRLVNRMFGLFGYEAELVQYFRDIRKITASVDFGKRPSVEKGAISLLNIYSKMSMA